MPYGQVDDRTPWMPKVRNASYACRGLVFSAALPYCAAGLTDGVLHPDFEADHARGREGKRAFREALERGFVHKAGELCDRCRAALAAVGARAPVAGWYLHDYLDHNPSKREVERRRHRNREKQQTKRERDRQSTLAWNADVTGDSPPHVTHGVEGGATTDDNGERSDHDAGAHNDPPGVVGEVLAILRRAERFRPVSALTYETGIESAIAAHPGKNPVAAAHEAVATVADPAWNMTNPLRVLILCLRKQPEGSATAPKTTGQNQAQQAGGLCRRCHQHERVEGAGGLCERCAQEVIAA